MPTVTIYTSEFCWFCRRAKQLLEDKGIDFDEIDVTYDAATRGLMTQRAGGRTSVPQIFVGDTHVGGCDDLYALDARGELDELLAAE